MDVGGTDTWRSFGEGRKGGWSHSESWWSVWSGKAAGGLHHHLLPKPSFPRRRAGGGRKDQGQYQALVKERTCGHLGLGLHHSFLLPDPATQMLSEGISTLSPDDPRALGLCWWLGFLTNSAATHLSSSHHHWPWPCMCWCLFPPLGPLFWAPWSCPLALVWKAGWLGERAGVRIFHAVTCKAGTAALPHFTTL